LPPVGEMDASMNVEGNLAQLTAAQHLAFEVAVGLLAGFPETAIRAVDR
jgi:hypothetical protein